MQLKVNRNKYFKKKIYIYIYIYIWYDRQGEHVTISVRPVLRTYSLLKYEDHAHDELSTPEHNLCMLRAFSNSPADNVIESCTFR